MYWSYFGISREFQISVIGRMALYSKVLAVDYGIPNSMYNYFLEYVGTSSAVFDLAFIEGKSPHNYFIVHSQQLSGLGVGLLIGIISLFPSLFFNFYPIYLLSKLKDNTSSKLFYTLLGYLTETKIDSSVANFGIFNRKTIDAVLSMTEAHKYFPIMVRWVGFSSKSISTVHSNRLHDSSSYTFNSLVKLSLDVIMSFSNKPLKLIVRLGFMISFLSAFYAILIVIDVYISKTSVPGWSSVMVSIWFIGGMLMSIVGVVGLYVGKTFDESKSRPVFIVDEFVSSK